MIIEVCNVNVIRIDSIGSKPSMANISSLCWVGHVYKNFKEDIAQGARAISLTME